jgi:uncharacterized lipoprotein NlpE involved in copper resistance
VEADIKPFRTLLLGLFFVTTGCSINTEVLANYWEVRWLAAQPAAQQPAISQDWGRLHSAAASHDAVQCRSYRPQPYSP